MTLTALANSAAFDAVEGDLKQLFMDVFAAQLADGVADALALAVPEAGSQTVLRQSLNDNGLVLIEQLGNSAFYHRELLGLVLKAWRGRNFNNRGLAFFRTLTKAMYPGAQIVPLWQPKAQSYGTGLFIGVDQADTSAAWLTSRLQVTTHAAPPTNLGLLRDLIAYTLPARFVIHYVEEVAASPAEAEAAVSGHITVVSHLDGAAQAEAAANPAELAQTTELATIAAAETLAQADMSQTTDLAGDAPASAAGGADETGAV
ncbi:hypothetical protein [Methylovulum psychrotolerans]|uniref:Uncharacterized protein n=1 Tax=Methylovulum psychrotolerans TaxID=1704499 RepID=A0A1Z4C457_9GAMM|nr:hypothetical protein [Methylovulum psychrotolerans]ASF48299.1 hypothetical protein CEK71_20760 [Methylovulum psychrotolerans]